MDKDFFVRNVKTLCLKKGIRPTRACKESGVGGSFLNDIKRGQEPSVAQIQMLASYLGVTVSQLLGRDASDIIQGPAQPYLVYRYNHMPKEDQLKVMTLVEELTLERTLERRKATLEQPSPPSGPVNSSDNSGGI